MTGKVKSRRLNVLFMDRRRDQALDLILFQCLDCCRNDFIA